MLKKMVIIDSIRNPNGKMDGQALTQRCGTQSDRKDKPVKTLPHALRQEQPAAE